MIKPHYKFLSFREAFVISCMPTQGFVFISSRFKKLHVRSIIYVSFLAPLPTKNSVALTCLFPSKYWDKGMSSFIDV
jgi:hypothetical protein